MSVAIVDYGVGNLFSLKSSFAAVGKEVLITSDPKQLEEADGVVLPGVGAFGDAIFALRSTGLDEVLCQIAASGKPLLGICLGMQMLFEESFEYGTHKGLGLIPGSIEPLRPVIDPHLMVPHIGWNALHFTSEDKGPLFADIDEGTCMYFVHSYYATQCAEHTIATVEYDIDVTASVRNGNVFGCQFHPEKSGEAGLRILSAFCAYGKEA